MYKVAAKKYRGVLSHDTESDAKFEEKLIFLFQKWQEVGDVWPEHLKFSKYPLWLVPFVQSI